MLHTKKISLGSEKICKKLGFGSECLTTSVFSGGKVEDPTFLSIETAGKSKQRGE